MKLKYTEGCIADSITVDNVESIDMDINDFRAVVQRLIDKEKDLNVLQGTFMHCLMSQGAYTWHGKCDECGDDIITFEIEI